MGVKINMTIQPPSNDLGHQHNVNAASTTTKPSITAGVAAILVLLEHYESMHYGLSKIEVQKLAYFLQAAGEDLKLSYQKHRFGPYADQLRHALDRMDGHYLHGVGDGVVESAITPDKQALAEAKQESATTAAQALEKVQRWNPRKKHLMKAHHVQSAWNQLQKLQWI